MAFERESRDKKECQINNWKTSKIFLQCPGCIALENSLKFHKTFQSCRFHCLKDCFHCCPTITKLNKKRKSLLSFVPELCNISFRFLKRMEEKNFIPATMKGTGANDISKGYLSVVEPCKIFQESFAGFTIDKNLREKQIFRIKRFFFTEFKGFFGRWSITNEHRVTVTRTKFTFQILFLTNSFCCRTDKTCHKYQERFQIHFCFFLQLCFLKFLSFPTNRK